MSTNKTDYIDNQRFFDELKQYKEEYTKAEAEGAKLPQIPKYICHSLILLAKNCTKHPRFYGYSKQIKEEMVLDAVENCTKYIRVFDVRYESKNPFSYFTTSIMRSFIRTIEAERLEIYVRYKTASRQDLLDESEFENSDGEALQPAEIYDNMSEFIEKFEKQQAEKKAKKKAKAALKKKAKTQTLEKYVVKP